MRGLVALAMVVFGVFLPAHSHAQTINATLGGTVSDATGALIPGVTITATNAATGIVSSVISNEAGAYQFASLQSGTYKVSAELQGFQTAVYDQVALLPVSLQFHSADTASQRAAPAGCIDRPERQPDRV